MSEYDEWRKREDNLKWYQLSRDTDGVLMVLKFLQALARQPFTWIGLLFLILAIIQEWKAR